MRHNHGNMVTAEAAQKYDPGRQLKLVQYVCCEVGTASGIYLDGSAPGKLSLPPPGPHEDQPLRGVRLRDEFGGSTEAILDAAASAYVSWEQAALASEHVGRHVLPLRVRAPAGTLYELTQLVGWELRQLEPGEPPALNLHMRGAPVIDVNAFNMGARVIDVNAFNMGARAVLGNNEQVLHERAVDLHVVVAIDGSPAREPVTHAEVAGALDAFEAAAGELESDG